MIPRMAIRAAAAALLLAPALCVVGQEPSAPEATLEHASFAAAPRPDARLFVLVLDGRTVEIRDPRDGSVHTTRLDETSEIAASVPARP